MSEMINSVIQRNGKLIDLAGASVKTLQYLALEADQLDVDPKEVGMIGNILGALALVAVIVTIILWWREWKELGRSLYELHNRLEAHEQLASANEPQYIELVEPRVERAV